MSSPEQVDTRRNPGKLLPGAVSVVTVALAYPRSAPAPKPGGGVPAPIRGEIARYARGRDYHQVLGHRLRELSAAIGELTGAPVQARACVDTAPLLERDLAERAGVGFTGKNTMLIIPGIGSYVLLGELLIAAEIAPTSAERSRPRCGSCRACLDACPSSAFAAEYVLDARACISYLTIEHRGVIPTPLRQAIGTRIFGCDECQEACPYNTAAADRAVADPDLSPSDRDRAAPDLLDLLQRGSNQRKRYVQGTALRRINREQWTRNLCIALGNAGDSRAIPLLASRLTDRSALVRGHAAWALGRLGAGEPCARALPNEEDAWVREELGAALSAQPGS